MSQISHEIAIETAAFSDAAKQTLHLTLTRGLGPKSITRLLARYGSPGEANDAIQAHGPDALKAISRLGEARAVKIAKDHLAVLESGELARELERIEAAETALICESDSAYPALLSQIPDCPPLLYVQGNPAVLSIPGLAIVGSRKCTRYGREQAAHFAGAIGQMGVAIVSGGAYGIDAAAHRATMDARGVTTAVLGSGLNKKYPSEHAALFERIGEEGGAVVSEYAMNTTPKAEHFPRRNRIVAGLSIGVLVIEAAIRSGALITARLALEEQGREVMALPGPVDAMQSRGCNTMLKEGWAHLVTQTSDVIQILRESALFNEQMNTSTGVRSPEDVVVQDNRAPEGGESGLSYSQIQQQIRQILVSPGTLDELVEKTELPVHQLQAEITMLEIMGAITRDGNQLRLT